MSRRPSARSLLALRPAALAAAALFSLGPCAWAQSAGEAPAATTQASAPSGGRPHAVWASEFFGIAVAAAHSPTPATSRAAEPGPPGVSEPVPTALPPPVGGIRLRLDATWQAAQELVASVNPFVKGPQAPSVTPPAAVETGGKAVRLTELPEVIGLPAVLPVATGKPSTAGVAQGLTLQKAIELSLARSYSVRAAQAKLDAARHTVRAAQGNLLPQVEGRAGFGRGELDSVSPAERLQRREGTLTVRQPLFDLGARREIERQQALATAAELQYQAAVSEASQEAAGAYLQALQARINLAMGERYESQLARLLTLMEARASGGGASEAERNRVQARVSNARAQMAEGASTLRSAMRRLNALIGQTPQAFELAGGPGIVIPADVEAARSDAARLNRELLAGRAEAVAIAYEALSHRAKLLPRLDLEVSHARALNAGGSPGYTRDTRGMLVVNWQLYNGGTDMAQKRAAEARGRERDLRGDDLLRRLDQELESAYAALEAVAPRFASQREELVANTQVVTAFEAQLVGGNRPLLDVLDAYQRLHSNRLELASLVVNEVLSTLQVAMLTGRLMPAQPATEPKDP